ncbi:hypothetical protein JW868_00175 [Candidatus Woesearchaeota archaeon]|nr:hypothetical protein [Candidatus Woesearchaeota archaeon]
MHNNTKHISEVFFQQIKRLSLNNTFDVQFSDLWLPQMPDLLNNKEVIA